MRKGNTIYGIQGGKGSFNEEAILNYLPKKGIDNYEIRYLFTTPKVLQALDDGKIDFGLFAIENSVGGLVEESIYAMADHQFKIVKKFSILIRRFLMKKREIELENIKTIMAHPQVLKQCRTTLKRKYPDLLLASGKGDLIDTAEAAKALSVGKLSPDIAVLGPENLSNMYDLEIVDRDLQDNKNNLTGFLLVSKQ